MRTASPPPPNEIPRLITWLAFLIALLLLGSCSPLERLARLERKHPQLFNRSNDTIRVVDTFTVIVPGTHTDTVVHWSSLVDTILLTQDNLTVRVWSVNDSVYIDAKTDTIFVPVIREIKVPYTKYVNYRKARDNLRWEFILATVVIVCGIVVNYYLKRKTTEKK